MNKDKRSLLFEFYIEVPYKKGEEKDIGKLITNKFPIAMRKCQKLLNEFSEALPHETFDLFGTQFISAQQIPNSAFIEVDDNSPVVLEQRRKEYLEQKRKKS